MDFNRTIQKKIESKLFSGKIIAVYGARRTGKTTLAKKILEKYRDKYKTKYISCENVSVKEALNVQDALRLKQFLGDNQLIVLDEAQSVKDIGINLKILVDHYPEIQIIATGSSSFDLANEINEPLTGRVWSYFLPPFTVEELRQKYDTTGLNSMVETLLTYGSYPQVFLAETGEKEQVLKSIAENYLYKDILAFEGQKHSDFLLKLLQLLAYQVGSEVSINELANTLNRSKTLVEKYLYLLEETFVIFRLGSLRRNLRKEVTAKKKVYFWDVGIRNSLINNFNPLVVRPDKGALWENFCIAERLKFLETNHMYANSYFWRVLNGGEIDYIEEYGGKLKGYEIKWKDQKVKEPKEFLKAYDNADFQIVSQYDAWDFIMKKI